MALGVVLSHTGPQFWCAVMCAIRLEYRSRVRRPRLAASLACNDGGSRHGLSPGSGAGVEWGGIRQCGGVSVCGEATSVRGARVMGDCDNSREIYVSWKK